MRIILDTNVFVSGVFFERPSSTILAAWRDGRVGLVVSPEILNEYARVGGGRHGEHRDEDQDGGRPAEACR
jgi:predicted nucleic acid-binding protein